MKKLLLAALVFLSTSLFANDFALWEKSTLNKIQTKGELRVGMEPGYMPFEMKDKKGNVIGFDVDVARTMAKAMGVRLKIVPTAWDGIIGSLITDKFDIIMSGMTITQERNMKINFADPYVVVGQSLLVGKSVDKMHKTVADLDISKYTLVTKLGTTADFASRRLFKTAKLKTFDTEAEAVQEVLNGKADIFMYDLPYNVAFMAQKGKGLLNHLDTPLTFEPIGFGIRKGDPDFLNWLNNFLRQIKNDGSYDEMYEKWFVKTDWLKRVQ